MQLRKFKIVISYFPVDKCVQWIESDSIIKHVPYPSLPYHIVRIISKCSYTRINFTYSLILRQQLLRYIHDGKRAIDLDIK